jgi:hypothetical protein
MYMHLSQHTVKILNHSIMLHTVDDSQIDVLCVVSITDFLPLALTARREAVLRSIE